MATVKEFFEEHIAFDKYLGLLVEELRPGWVRVRLPYRPEFLGDPFRKALHGGVISTVVDATAGAAALSTLPYGSRCSTVDMRVDYLLPAQPQELLAEGTVLRTGNQVAVINVEVFQRENQRIATGRAVYSLKAATSQ
ncbi:MAG: hotdog fold thioesterase [Candidatus Eremiobacteraeota bacterium]|nr:hotdog fold thioesterase [Candidatus Eremiobacteraeota bacterium]MCW5872152.1 hotdog fold thioesterase [Candidatus Eremiobacteraeota bacterium]